MFIKYTQRNEVYNSVLAQLMQRIDWPEDVGVIGGQDGDQRWLKITFPPMKEVEDGQQ